MSRRERTQFLCSLFMIAFATFSGAKAHGKPLISDGLDGVSCKYLVAAGRMAWQRPGGDWVDSAGTSYGSAAFATTQVPRTRAGQLVNIDMTSLARAWQKGELPAGGIFLTSAPDAATGRVRFHSRESDDVNLRPVLTVIWQDGRTEELPVAADATLSCSTNRVLGEGRNFAVGKDANAVLLFPFNVQQGRAIKEARLTLVVEKSYGAAFSIYRPLVPGTQGSVAEPGLSKAFTRDAGIEKHPAVVFSERFETDDWKSRIPPSSKSNSALTDAGTKDDFVPLDGRALKVTIPKGKNQALNAHFRFSKEIGQEPEEMYFRYALRLGENWDPSSSGGKLPGFSGARGSGGWGGRKSNGTNGWATRGAFFQQRVQDSPFGELRGIGSYVYHADMEGNYGAMWGWNLGNGGLLEKSRWYSVEQHVRMNTPGRNDGVLKAWIDGVLAFERTDLRFRDIPDLKIESLWLNVWYGGTDPAPKEMTLYIDNLVIARQYIGPIQGR